MQIPISPFKFLIPNPDASKSAQLTAPSNDILVFMFTTLHLTYSEAAKTA